MEILVVGVAALIVIAGATALGPRLRVAAPLILVVLGIVVSFLPVLPDFEVDPEWILAGILPPLLYSAAVSMPAMNFRRELNAIGGLSIVLVVLSAVVLGFFFSLVIPGLGIWWGIALGAIVSPTDAVATSIVRRLGVGGRIVSVLEGESLLNDATALVLLRSAIAATAAAVSFWDVAGDFAFAVAIAAVLGVVVGFANLWVRQRVTDSTVNTVLSFTVPFLASIPAELLGASGLVAAVVAGLITGHGAARRLSPQHRASDAQNWRTVELVLEGGIFLIMGLELSALMADVEAAHEGVHNAVIIALGALLLTVLVRAAYLTPLLTILRGRRLRREQAKPRIEALNERLGESGEPAEWPFGRRAPMTDQRVRQTRTRLRRLLADMDYYVAEPLGWREGGVLVWAGMRGAVTLAAAQTLPSDTPNRSLLVLIAFFVAAASLMLQGGTLSRVVRWLKPAGVDEDAQRAERAALLELLSDVSRRVREEQGLPPVGGPASAVVVDTDADARNAHSVRSETSPDSDADGDAYGELTPEEQERDALDGGSRHAPGASGSSGGSGPGGDGPGGDGPGRDASTDEDDERVALHARMRAVTLAVILAQREALLDARDDGTFDAESLDMALATLDAAQISLELQGAPPER
ncbi:sodium/proton antiporter (CPA1 family) [Labedella gwakjiensis]|uniref:Sodium/proton antiporter (CPA1 family) n=1 Tax=Labedella gwakjiensis TaxID=390269 RepID=A0A2P8GZ72_9MICO|nr:sodium:proton antiporter [Labedella gwakjiensis]PSL39255.1 sodium/proton antiporter (CPA1 family) [Labedella gwakjiensis]RUQ86322.1 sodium:proton antiporter [Labedella gwakjiensis]